MSPASKSNETAITAAVGHQSPSAQHTIPSFDTLPDGAFIRASRLVIDPKRPDVPAPVPFSAPTLWRKVKAKTFPAPVKLSERVTAWRVGDVRDWLKQRAAAEGGNK